MAAPMRTCWTTSTSATGVRVDLGAQTASGGDAQGDSISGFEAVQGGTGGDTLRGGGGGQTLLGNNGDDLVSGGAGDRIQGMDGADTVLGDGDAATLLGGNGNDLLVAGPGTSMRLQGGADNDILAIAGRGTVTVTDLGGGEFGISGAGLGATTVSGVEFIQLRDGRVTGFAAGAFAVCFAAGTRILTDQGEVVVEALQAGDRVATLGLGGAAIAPVLWVGRRRIALAGHRQAEALSPIRITAGALGAGVPARDLLVSPDHCLFLDGALVPARLLVNGGTIVVERGLAEVTYFHVELDRHDVLIAEGAAAESWLDAGNRDWFANAEVALLHVAAMPDGYATSQPEPCAPVVQGGPRLAAIRDAVALVAARERRRAVA